MELVVTIRGGERRVRWDDGMLHGDEEILHRLDRVTVDGQVDPHDLLSVVRGVELVTAQHVELVNLDLVEPLDGAGLTAPDHVPLAGSTS